jgi:hypothetical protein
LRAKIFTLFKTACQYKINKSFIFHPVNPDQQQTAPLPAMLNPLLPAVISAIKTG